MHRFTHVYRLVGAWCGSAEYVTLMIPLQVSEGTWLQQRVGNTYTASLYFALARLWELKVRALRRLLPPMQ